MALRTGEQIKYWGAGALVFFLFIWMLSDILLPFLTGMIMAYFLDPIADRLEKIGCSRILSISIIMLVGVLTGLILIILIVPQLIKQLTALADVIPQYLEQVKQILEDILPNFLNKTSSLGGALDSFSGTLANYMGEMANVVLASAFSVVDAAIFLIVAPVVSFYMLLDWDRMIATIDSWLPLDHRENIRMLARDLDKTMASFIRGQLTVCSILGTFYAVALMLVGLPFGMIVGLIAGLLTFIPYVGSLIGGGLSIGLALFQFWGQPEWIIVVILIFIIGQMFEGNYLTPKLVGDSVGLHPVWLMFALSAFGSVLGFTGMLIAVPVAACMGVFLRFGLKYYLRGRLYQGQEWYSKDDAF